MVMKFLHTEFKRAIYRRDASEHLTDIVQKDAQPVKPGDVILSGDTRLVVVPEIPQGHNGRWVVSHPIPSANVGEHVGFLAFEHS